MNIFNIFNKNIKTVSRNFSYFAVLFICPILLILISGAVLNSASLNNIRVGIVGGNVQEIRNAKNYDSFALCMEDLVHFKVVACLNFNYIDGHENLDIYISNSNKLVSIYTRQFVLKDILNMQQDLFEKTSSEINSQISVYSGSILNARTDLVNARSELEEQEKLLTDYKNDLEGIRRDFDEVYYPLKQMQPQITQIRTDLTNQQNTINSELSIIKNNINNIKSNLQTLNTYLSSKLNSGDYDYASGLVSSALLGITSIESSLNVIEQANKVNSDLIGVVDSLDNIIQQLDEIKQTLDKLDSDLGISIQRTRESKDKINAFINSLDNVNQELGNFQSDIGSKKFSYTLEDAFVIPDDPVLFAFPLLIALVITFTSLVLSNMFILKEVNHPSYDREILTPAKDMEFLISDYLVNLFFVGIQASVLFLVGIYWVGVSLNEIWMFVLAIFFVASIFIFIGMSFAYLIRNQSLSMLITLFSVMILIVLSDILAPSILAGEVVKFFIDSNPFVVLQRILSDGIVLNRPLGDSYFAFVRMGILFIMTFFIAYVCKKISKERR